MILKKSLILLLLNLPLMASVENLNLDTALQMLKENNLELKISRFNEQMKSYESKAVKGQNYGKLDLSLTGMRSNDAGNVFGFKLQSREATFGDFGFAEFDTQNPNILNVQPQALNYPDARNYYQTKISYMLPLYTGGKLSEYGRITKTMQRMSQYDTQRLLNEKIFQTKKSFYDISLIQNYIYNLSKIIKNIKHLENIINNMEKEGYAKEIDALEVQARLAEAQSMYNQAKLNRDLAYQFLSFLLNTEVKSITKVNDMATMPKVHMDDVENNNIDIQKAKLGLEVTQMAVEVEKANYLPTVGAFGEYASADDSLWNEFTQKDSYTVGVQVKWNLFNGGSDDANLEKARVNYMKVQDQVALAKSGIALKVKKLQTEILSKNADVKSYQKQLEFARKVYENYSSRYKEGIVSITDVLIKQSKELEMLLKLLTVKNERNTKIFELNSIINSGENI
ncbi:TolC family protein [Sulfurovum lithotrophicum]|nr:TolC family protein [Sulfurovum lithotrophicum]